MAGPFSFLPLNNKPNLKRRVQAKTADTSSQGSQGKILPEHRPSTVSAPEVEMEDKDDDEWYDTESSEDGQLPVSRNKNMSNTDVENSVVTVKPVSPDEEKDLLPYMPALFSKDLPPCGLEIQVAYESVNLRLRESWLNHRGRRSAVDVCQDLRDVLVNQNYLWPAYTLKGRVKKRKPWRREAVFKYELNWIDYFLREAQQQSPELMTESELMERRKQGSIPVELKMNVERSDVLAMWDEWNQKKSTPTRAMPNQPDDTQSGAETSVPTETLDQKTNDAPKDTLKPERPPPNNVFKPRPSSGATDDAHVWSDGGHD